jgi:hypothetical protein
MLFWPAKIRLCNPFCRDKTLADPAVWVKFIALVAKIN